MTMQKVTYLLGAGASAGCIPVVNNMAKSLLSTSSRFGDIFFKKPGLPQKDAGIFNEIELYNANVKEILFELEWLRDICNTHYSIDTYAKKLFIKRDEAEYLKLKNSLSLYFTIQQILVPPDKRYDNFWASILSGQFDFPKQLRIISWNYDSQLELSYKNFTSSSSLQEAYGKIKMASFHDNVNHVETDEFAIFKLNGSAKAIKKDSHRTYTDYLIKNFDLPNEDDEAGRRKLFDKLLSVAGNVKIDGMKTMDENLTTAISFAWEHSVGEAYYLKLRDSIIDTDILVVIGYSFPFFNRKIDKLIINDFMPHLEKVYFQAPDAENLKERFLAITDKIQNHNLILRKDENQFTFPNELDI
jgi:hypothetical protein